MKNRKERNEIDYVYEQEILEMNSRVLKLT